MTALTLGAVAGLGLLLICLGLTRPTALPPDPGRLPQLTAGVAVGLLAAVGVWLVCGWPVLTLAALAAGLLVPRWWTHRAEVAAQASRSEAIAEVAAGLRDAVRGGLGVTDALGGLARWGPTGAAARPGPAGRRRGRRWPPPRPGGLRAAAGRPTGRCAGGHPGPQPPPGGPQPLCGAGRPGRRHPRRSPHPPRGPRPPGPAAALGPAGRRRPPGHPGRHPPDQPRLPGPLRHPHRPGHPRGWRWG